MSIYRFLECGTFSVTVEVEASSKEEALELIEDGEGKEVEGSLQYYGSQFELQEIDWNTGSDFMLQEVT